eukprot:m.26846 g.26846  ORF g.26846 m.26846 type:complete len:378 (-) comp8360_c0_seq2:2-1135(-)
MGSTSDVPPEWPVPGAGAGVGVPAATAGESSATAAPLRSDECRRTSSVNRASGVVGNSDCKAKTRSSSTAAATAPASSPDPGHLPGSSAATPPPPEPESRVSMDIEGGTAAGTAAGTSVAGLVVGAGPSLSCLGSGRCSTRARLCPLLFSEVVRLAWWWSASLACSLNLPSSILFVLSVGLSVVPSWSRCGVECSLERGRFFLGGVMRTSSMASSSGSVASGLWSMAAATSSSSGGSCSRNGNCLPKSVTMSPSCRLILDPRVSLMWCWGRLSSLLSSSSSSPACLPSLPCLARLEFLIKRQGSEHAHSTVTFQATPPVAVASSVLRTQVNRNAFRDTRVSRSTRCLRPTTVTPSDNDTTRCTSLDSPSSRTAMTAA